MEVKIGVQYAARELIIEYPGTTETVQQAVSDALGDPDGMLVLEDSRGRRVLVPTQRIAYVEIGEQTERRVGFANI